MGGEYVAYGRCGIGQRKEHGTLHALLNLADGHGGAVVVEKVVAVGAVLGQAVIAQQAVKGAQFRLAQVECLFEHFGAALIVLLEKI